ncbi:uncharacterized protein IAS62_005921 [Cryptococcus decagattii]|uniref:Uncharacterized protein n=1 Tax=Cryptococcus decagattii TaxID=1859122 RepID=A0ABZ2B1B1_9TREE
MRKISRLLSFEHPSLPHELGRRYLDAPISQLSISKTGNWEGITIKEQHDRQPVLIDNDTSLFSSTMAPGYSDAFILVLIWDEDVSDGLGATWLNYPGFHGCVRGMKILINEVKEIHQLLDRLDEIIKVRKYDSVFRAFNVVLLVGGIGLLLDMTLTIEQYSPSDHTVFCE